MKTAIIYASVHHGNTKKVVEAMTKVVTADAINILKAKNISFADYDLIGFASGIYFNTFDKRIVNYIVDSNFSKNQKVFLVYTCGLNYRDHAKDVKKLLDKKNVQCIGTFSCRGFDTFGIFKKIGGIAKGHPNKKDLANAQQFALETVKKCGRGGTRTRDAQKGVSFRG